MQVRKIIKSVMTHFAPALKSIAAVCDNITSFYNNTLMHGGGKDLAGDENGWFIIVSGF